MAPATLPDLLHRLTGVLILALASGLVAAHTAVAAEAARRARLTARQRLTWPLGVGLFLSLWLAVALAVGDRANFSPSGGELELPLTLLVGFGTMGVAIAWLFGSETLRRLNAATPPHWLIGIQVYRILGLMFVYPFLAYGVVPAGFALPAAIGDFVVAALAPVVALAVARGHRHAVAWAVAWNIFGILDLIVAPAAAVMSQAAVLRLYPLALVALFLGPPLGILTHVLSLRNLVVSRSSHPVEAREDASVAEAGTREARRIVA
jgi:hypothetical protein